MSRFARFIDALHESRQREATRVVSRHVQMIEEARHYERYRETVIAEAKAAEAAAATPRPTLRLASRSAS